MKTDHEVLNEKNISHLRAALAAGEYFTERVSVFYTHPQADPTYRSLQGETVIVPAHARCIPVRAVGNSLLVRYTDSIGKHSFAWIHP